MHNTIVSLSDVTIRFPDGSSFAHVDFEVKQGEHIAIVGNNEPLKSALIDALAGNTPVIKGKVSYPFFEPYRKTEHGGGALLSPRKFIGYISSRHSFRNLSNTNDFYYQQRFNSSDSENSLTVEAYLSSLKSYVASAKWTREQVFETLKLKPLLGEELIKLSNGETKRVLIAAALLRNPVLLLLNNPFTGLDINSRKEIADLINQLASSAITVVMSVSVNEIPECITQVAIAGNENRITQVAAAAFDAASIVLPYQDAIDEREVKALIGISALPVYDTVVHMKDVVIRYGEKVILDNIHWTVRQGERWALLGHNGAGKSTLLSLINGDNPQAFANNIILFDRKKGSGESIWDIKRKIGFFSSELYQYFPTDTTCLHAVESGFYDTTGLFRPSHQNTREIALRWMRLLSVDHLATKTLKNVSVVNQRLCLLARALVKSPALLILDEPCQGFDDSQRTHFKNLLNLICFFRNVTLIYVSHYREEIPECVNKSITLQNGRKVELI